MQDEIFKKLLQAVEKLDGFDRTIEDHTDALRTNKLTLEAIVPMIIASHFQMVNVIRQLGALQMATLTSLDRNQVLKIANSTDEIQSKNDEYMQSADLFVNKISELG